MARPTKPSTWKPVYSVTPKAAKLLSTIDAAKAAVERTALPADVAAELRRRAQIRSAHYSTKIEGELP